MSVDSSCGLLGHGILSSLFRDSSLKIFASFDWFGRSDADDGELYVSQEGVDKTVIKFT